MRPFRVPVEQALRTLGRAESPIQVQWRHVAGAPRYVVQFAVPPLIQVVDGESGQPQPLPSVDMQLARQAALWDAPPGVGIKSCVMQTAGSLVYPAWNELPALRVTLDNGDDVYVSPSTGEILAHVDTMFRAVRIAFYGLHVWKFSPAAESPASYLVLLVMGLVLAAAGATGLWLGLRRWR